MLSTSSCGNSTRLSAAPERAGSGGRQQRDQRGGLAGAGRALPQRQRARQRRLDR